MPKKVRRAIACPRAKKKKVEQTEAVEDEAGDLEEGEEAEDETPPPPEPCAAPAPNADSEALPMPQPMHVTLEQEEAAAWHQLQVVNRRWRKTIETHFDRATQWATKSELDRVLERLRHADDEHDQAEDQYERCRLQRVRYRTYSTLKRQASRFPGHAVAAKLRDDAKAAYDAARSAALTRGLLHDDEPVKRPNRGLDIGAAIELVAREVGLATAFQLIPLHELRLGMDGSESPEALAEAKAQSAVLYRSMLRERIEHHLQLEKEGRCRRSERSLMLHTSRDERGVIVELLREMGECLCHRPGIERVEDRCEICRAEGSE